MTRDNLQYDNLMRLYSRRRNANASLLEERRHEIRTSIPEYEEIEDRISQIALQTMRANLTHQKDDAESHKNDAQWELNSLNDLQKQLLREHGYPEDYLDAIYNCKDCHDTGFYNGHFCHCFKKSMTDLMIQQTGIAHVLKQENFSYLREDYYSPNFIDPASGKNSLEIFHEALDKCRTFVNDFDTAFSNLFFYGDTGVGKTFLSNCIAWELLNRGVSVVYMTSSEYFQTMADIRFNRNDDEEENLTDYITDCDLLIIDDLGTELTNKFTASEFFSCINSRILKHKSTIISSNLTLDQIQEFYSERVFSRIMSDFVLIKLVGDDIRIKKKLRNCPQNDPDMTL